jgi:ribulose-5-phosphate 4-epimerase/fuculose-1-phosphate aldolase
VASELEDVRYNVAIANRILALTGLAIGATASLGHASLRLPSDPNKFVVKGRGYAVDALARINPDQMVVCDIDGNLVDGPPGATQCFEVKMHSSILKTHPNINSVVHVHPRYVVALSVLQKRLVPMCQEGIHLVRYPLPVWPHTKTVQTDEEGMEVAELLGDSKVMLFFGHGAAATGATLIESVTNMINLEEQAKMNWYAYCAAGPDHPSIPDEYIDEMINRPKLWELPQFAPHMDPKKPMQVTGVWDYYALLAKEQMAAGL